MFHIGAFTRRIVTVSMGALSAGWTGAATAHAASTAASLAQVTRTSTRNYYVEIGVVVLMVGAALFAVCRSTGRS